MAERILITVWMMIFQISLFFIRSLVKGLVFSLFYFGYWLLAVGSSYCHAELVSASHREPLLLLLRGQILKFAIKREQSQACLNYAEREQIEQR